MKQQKLWYWLWVIITVLCTAVPASALHRVYITYLCLNKIIPGEIIRNEFPPDPIVVPVGCEAIDCCPGCPGGMPLDWRVSLSGDPIIEAITLQFEYLPPEANKKLNIKGNAKWLGNNRLRIGKGETILSGFIVDPKVRPAVAIPQVIAGKDAKQPIKLYDKTVRKKAQKDAGRAELLIEQLLGNTVVNEFRILYVIRWCLTSSQVVIPTTDQIDLDNNAGNDNAVVLLDGRRSSGCADDEVWRGNDKIDVNNVLAPGGCNCEVAVFSDDDAMQLIENVNAWTDSVGDLLRVDLTPDLLQMPVTIWVMHGPFAATQALVINDMARANQLYNSMNCGIGFQTAAINDVTTDPNTAGLIDANCTKAADLRNQIGFINNNLNVYYVRNPGARGWWCGNNTILIGSGADNESLAHEIGHALSLGHTNAVAGIPGTNLMVTGGVGRNSITEGQCFRCNVNTNSRLNLNGVRAGATRNCPDGTTNDRCPDLSLDIVPK